MEKKEFIELIIVSVIALVLVVYYLIKAVKNHWLKALIETTKTAVMEAEAKYSNGFEKKKYVLNKIQDKCSELDIPYVFLYKLINKTIEKYIEGYNAVKKGK